MDSLLFRLHCTVYIGFHLLVTSLQRFWVKFCDHDN